MTSKIFPNLKRKWLFVIGVLLSGFIYVTIGPSEIQEDVKDRSTHAHGREQSATTGAISPLVSRLRQSMGLDKYNKSMQGSYVNQQMIQSPFSSRGMNIYAKKYYGITDEQDRALANLAQTTRLKIVNVLAERLEKVEQTSNSQQVWIFRTSEEFADTVFRDFRRDLMTIVDAQVADACMPALRNCDSFLGAGQFDVVFYVSPDKSGRISEDSWLKIDFKNKKGEVSSSWGGSALLGRDMLSLDFVNLITK